VLKGLCTERSTGSKHHRSRRLDDDEADAGTNEPARARSLTHSREALLAARAAILEGGGKSEDQERSDRDPPETRGRASHEGPVAMVFRHQRFENRIHRTARANTARVPVRAHKVLGGIAAPVFRVSAPSAARGRSRPRTARATSEGRQGDAREFRRRAAAADRTEPATV